MWKRNVTLKQQTVDMTGNVMHLSFYIEYYSKLDKIERLGIQYKKWCKKHKNKINRYNSKHETKLNIIFNNLSLMRGMYVNSL